MTVLRFIKLQIILALLLLFFLTGCIHPISEQTREQTATGTTFSMVKTNPAAFIDEQLLLGGVIVSIDNTEDETLLEIMRWHLNQLGEPTYLEEEGSRFLVQTQQNLDPKVYEPGVLVTLAGVVAGQKDRLLGEHEYTYPVFTLKEIHPWESPFRYGIHRYPGPDYPYYIGGDKHSNRNPYDPGYSIYPYTQFWYRGFIYPYTY